MTRNIYNITVSPKQAGKLAIDDRSEKTEETEAYITVKAHKENFLHKLSFCLTNQSKSDISKVSKNLLHKINKKIKS